MERDPNRVYFRAGGFEQSRPILSGSDAKDTFEFIPIIDVTDIFSPYLEVRKKLAAEIGRAVKDVGFFYAVNPPVSTNLMDKSFAVIKKFFDLPLEVKNKYVMSNSPSFKGYMPSKTVEKNAPDRDSFSVGTDFTEPEQVAARGGTHLVTGPVPQNQWPDEIPEFRKTFYEYYHQCYRFAQQLFRIFALSLGLEESAFAETFKSPLTDVMIQHYFPAPERKNHEELLFGHADFCEGIPGLEVLNDNGIYVPAPPIEHSFIVNTGAYFELLSNSTFPATVHRVRTNLGLERFSFPIFFSPDPTVLLQPHPALVKEGEEPKYTPHYFGRKYINTLAKNMPDHPWVKALKLSGIKEEDYKFPPKVRVAGVRKQGYHDNGEEMPAAVIRGDSMRAQFWKCHEYYYDPCSMASLRNLVATMSFMMQRCSGLLRSVAARPQGSTCNLGFRRNLHEYLVIVRDERDIQGLDLKPTFAGKVLTEGSEIPKTVFACQGASIEAIKEAMRKHSPSDLSNVDILPLETVHTSYLGESSNA
ncbi:hypothetical protein V494_02576 [Pseudogymnoascus sp. VKM F-4513 (FW-928)]|nr:hypothetical protein V494_02576 [Pseudogymnoascus sp. VKM F-4513 (FW-928)]